MDHETPDLIEAQMAETRQSLTDKVAALEDSVVGTMQNATAAVSDTVQSVKDAVGDTVNAVKDNVASALDMGKHVRENPWTAVGSAALAGLLTGFLVFRKSSAVEPYSRPAPRLVPEPIATTTTTRTVGTGVFDSLMGRIGDEVKKLGDMVIDRVSSEFHRVVEDGVPRIVDKLTFAPPNQSGAEAVESPRWGGLTDPVRRAS